MADDSAYRIAAIKRWEDDHELIEVDRCTAAGATDILVLREKGGAWVKAWVWVTDEDAADLEAHEKTRQ